MEQQHEQRGHSVAVVDYVALAQPIVQPPMQIYQIDANQVTTLVQPMHDFFSNNEARPEGSV